jgi:transcriptional regulator GlxA family with amidase domain
MEHVQVLIYDGFDELDAIAPFEILAAAGFTTELVTVRAAPNVRSAYGARIIPGATLAPAPDLLVVPGGGWASRAPRGAWAESLKPDLPDAIADRHGAGSVVAGVCSGVMLVATAGLLHARPAVTHHAAIDDLRERGADVRADARVVDDGDVITAGGVTAGIDLALHIVAREHGIDAARAATLRIEHHVRGPILRTRRVATGLPESNSPVQANRAFA